MSNASQRAIDALEAALSNMRADETSLDLDSAIVVLAPYLGTPHPSGGTIRGIKAVLSRTIWPNKYDSTIALCAAYKTSTKRYYAYFSKVQQLRTMGQSVSACPSASAAGGASSAAGTARSGVSCAASGSHSSGEASLAGSSSDAAVVPAASIPETSGGPHHSPGSASRTRASDLTPDHSVRLRGCNYEFHDLPLEQDTLEQAIISLDDNALVSMWLAPEAHALFARGCDP